MRQKAALESWLSHHSFLVYPNQRSRQQKKEKRPPSCVHRSTTNLEELAGSYLARGYSTTSFVCLRGSVVGAVGQKGKK